MAEPVVRLLLSHGNPIEDPGRGWDAKIWGLPDRVNRLIALFVNEDDDYEWNAMGGHGYLYMWHRPAELTDASDQPEPCRPTPRLIHHFLVVLLQTEA